MQNDKIVATGIRRQIAELNRYLFIHACRQAKTAMLLFDTEIDCFGYCNVHFDGVSTYILNGEDLLSVLFAVESYVVKVNSECWSMCMLDCLFLLK